LYNSKLSTREKKKTQEKVDVITFFAR